MQVYKSKVLHVALVLLLAFIPLMMLFNPYNLYLIMGSFLFATSLASVHAYWPALRLSANMAVGTLSRIDVLTMAIIFLLFATAMREAYVTFYLEWRPMPQRRPDSYFAVLAFIRYTAVCAAMLFLCSRKSASTNEFFHKIPGWPRGVMAFSVGVALSLVMIFH